MDIYEIRAEIDCLEDDLSQAYDRDEEEEIRELRSRIDDLKEREYGLRKVIK